MTLILGAQNTFRRSCSIWLTSCSDRGTCQECIVMRDDAWCVIDRHFNDLDNKDGLEENTGDDEREAKTILKSKENRKQYCWPMTCTIAKTTKIITTSINYHQNKSKHKKRKRKRKWNENNNVIENEYDKK
jgi:hypothetical protein